MVDGTPDNGKLPRDEKAPYQNEARYDPDADALYVYLGEPQPSYKQVSISESEIADLNTKGEIIGIELLGFKRKYEEMVKQSKNRGENEDIV